MGVTTSCIGLEGGEGSGDVVRIPCSGTNSRIETKGSLVQLGRSAIILCTFFTSAPGALSACSSTRCVFLSRSTEAESGLCHDERVQPRAGRVR